MIQHGFAWDGLKMVRIELPAENMDVIPGVKWGSICAFPSPAYWKYQVLARRIQGTQIRYRLGTTLAEEVGACLLGGHGIPASVGLVAFEHLKARGAFDGRTPQENDLLTWLKEPIKLGDRFIRYRFAQQKAKYLAAAFSKLEQEQAPNCSGQALRNWLLDVPGIGYKTASWIARNWLDADDVAILDIHILRAGHISGFFKKELTVERHYLELEKQFIELSNSLDIRASELDAVIWHEMMSSPSSVRRAMEITTHGIVETKTSNITPRAKQRSPDTDQLMLIS